MSFLTSLNISASAMTAQKLRLDTISENISHINTTRTEAGGPYRRKSVVFQAIEPTDFRNRLNRALLDKTPGGVRVTEIIEDQTPFKPVYNPEHVDANEDGYVMMPNVDFIKETIDGMEASRAYEANITAFNAMKSMALKALEIGK